MCWQLFQQPVYFKTIYVKIAEYIVPMSVDRTFSETNWLPFWIIGKHSSNWFTRSSYISVFSLNANKKMSTPVWARWLAMREELDNGGTALKWNRLKIALGIRFDSKVSYTKGIPGRHSVWRWQLALTGVDKTLKKNLLAKNRDLSFVWVKCEWACQQSRKASKASQRT